MSSAFKGRWYISIMTITSENVKRISALSILALLAISLGLFFKVTGFEFTLDDLNHIQKNQLLESASTKEIFTSPTWPGNLFRPVFTSSLAINHYFSEKTPFTYHLSDLMIYAVTVVVLFLVLKLLFDFRLALFTSLIFAVHPIHVEVVSNVSHRSELLACLFGLLAILFSLRRSFLLMGVFLLLAFLSKESALSFLLLIPLSLYFSDKKGWLKNFTITSFAILACYFALRFNALGTLLSTGKTPFYVVNPLAHTDSVSRALGGISNLGLYASNLLLPLNLSPDYSFAVMSESLSALDVLKIIAALLVLVFSIKGFKQRVETSFFGLWFFLSFIITSNILFPIGTIFADRLAFTPSVSACGLIAFALLKIKKKSIFILLSSAVVLIFTLISSNLTQIWKSNVSLHSYAVVASPKSAKSHQNYAIVCLNEGRLDDAALHLTQALKIYPKYADAAYRMSFVYWEKKLPKGIEHWLREAIKLNSSHFLAQRDLALLLAQLSRFDEAKVEIAKALRLKPNDAKLIATLAEVNSKLTASAPRN